MSRQKLIIAYAFLVGLPLLGLMGILRGGQHLAAPLSVGGSWDLEADFNSLPAPGCREMLTSVAQPFVSIAQSGANLTFVLNESKKTTLTGTLEGKTLKMNPAGGADTGVCTDLKALRLEAAVGTQAAQRALSGLMTIDGCPACSPVPFRAVRLAPDHKESQ
ncbi:MAG TPA: hypothetical protein VG860_15225 [Terriglobia bacterium]|jgi:hypothetical protein|nr:hypothetical protein [Terriglobia bacterium]